MSLKPRWDRGLTGIMKEAVRLRVKVEHQWNQSIYVGEDWMTPKAIWLPVDKSKKNAIFKKAFPNTKFNL